MEAIKKGFLPMQGKHLKIYLNYKCRINDLISSLKISRPTMEVLNDECGRLSAEITEIKMPKYIKEWLHIYFDCKREELLKKYTILLTIGFDDRKIINEWDNLTNEEKQYIRDGNKLKRQFYWLEETAKATNDGIVYIKLTPTDKVYFTPN